MGEVVQLKKKLSDYKPEELQTFSIEDPDYHRKLYHEARAEKLASMQIPDGIKAWEAHMVQVNGGVETVDIWRVNVSFLMALVIARYGEDPRHWPDGLNEIDALAASDWALGRAPEGVVFANKLKAQRGQ